MLFIFIFLNFYLFYYYFLIFSHLISTFFHPEASRVCVDGEHWQQGLPPEFSRSQGHTQTEHKAVYWIREMNDIGEMYHFIWNDLQGGLTAIS